jgi:hypothetical protein
LLLKSYNRKNFGTEGVMERERLWLGWAATGPCDLTKYEWLKNLHKSIFLFSDVCSLVYVIIHIIRSKIIIDQVKIVSIHIWVSASYFSRIQLFCLFEWYIDLQLFFLPSRHTDCISQETKQKGNQSPTWHSVAASHGRCRPARLSPALDLSVVEPPTGSNWKSRRSLSVAQQPIEPFLEINILIEYLQIQAPISMPIGPVGLSATD